MLVTNSPTIKTSTKTTDKLSRITLTKTTPSINVDLHSVTTSTPVVINSNVQITTTTTTTTTTTKETVASTQSTTTAYKQNTTNMDQDQDDMAKILQGQKSQQSTVATTTTTKSTTLNQKVNFLKYLVLSGSSLLIPFLQICSSNRCEYFLDHLFSHRCLSQYKALFPRNVIYLDMVSNVTKYGVFGLEFLARLFFTKT